MAFRSFVSTDSSFRCSLSVRIPYLFLIIEAIECPMGKRVMMICDRDDHGMSCGDPVAYNYVDLCLFVSVRLMMVQEVPKALKFYQC